MHEAMHPLTLFDADRARAREATDPMAHLCTVANIDAQGQPQIRTLVLREVDGVLAIFINATSPKWPTMQSSFALQTFWPSVNIQYRMQMTVQPIESSIVQDSWHLRPEAPKRMDWFYEHHGVQSSAIQSREVLLEKLATLDLPDPMTPPDNARGLLLKPYQVERLDLNQTNGVHDRQLFELIADSWRSSTLVP